MGDVIDGSCWHSDRQTYTQSQLNSAPFFIRLTSKQSRQQEPQATTS